MERKITEFLIKWKNDKLKKPLLIYGPKGVGKTYSVLDFGKKYYKNTIYFNTDGNKEIINLFKKDKLPDRIIMNLGIMSGETILENDTLIVLDNVNSNEIVKSVKLFSDKYASYNIIMLTSRRENLSTFKGEELQFKSMSSMDFEEFLWAKEEKNLAGLIRESFKKKRSCPFHAVALDLFTEYLIVGGMPEVVDAYIKGASDNYLDSIKVKIIDTYKREFLTNKNLIDIERCEKVFDSIPYQLAKDNKKFQYGILGEGRRAKEFTSSIDFLVQNQMVYRSYKITEAKSPLSSCRDKESFKLYLNDVGLLVSMMHLTRKEIITNDKVRETLYENFIAKTLAELNCPIYYYQSEGKAELSFVVQNRMGKIIPIELATIKNSKSKSLSVFMKKFLCLEAYRITENNFSTKKEVRYLPAYAVFCLDEVLN